MYLFLLLDLFCLWLFLRLPKRMTPYEIVAGWLVTIVVYDDWLTIISVNLGKIETTHQLMEGILLGLQRVLLVPLIGVFFLEVWMRMGSGFKKAATFLGFVAVGVALQVLESWLDLIHNVGWSYRWTVLIWFLGGILLLGVNRVIKRLLQKARMES